MSQKEILQEKFKNISQWRAANPVKTHKQLFALYNFMDSTIRKEFQSFTFFNICGDQRFYQVDKEFEASFQHLSIAEKVHYYDRSVKILHSRIQGVPQSKLPQHNPIAVFVMKGLNKQQSCLLNFSENQLISLSERFDLSNYLLRRSKKNSTNSNSLCCLDAMRKISPGTPKSLRFEFVGNSEEQLEGHYSYFKEFMAVLFQNYIWSLAQINLMTENNPIAKLRSGKPSVFKQENSQNWKESSEIKQTIKLSKKSQENAVSSHSMSIVEQFMKCGEDQNIGQDILEQVEISNSQIADRSNVRSKAEFRKSLMGALLPQYRLAELELTNTWISERNEEDRMKILNHNRSNAVKVEVLYDCNAELLTKNFLDVQHYKFWNKEVTESCTRMEISSQNSAVMYQKHRPYSQWYRERDYLYIRHMFKLSDCYYIIDKSIENPLFLPFNSIFRGLILYSVTKITPLQQNTSRMFQQIAFDHGGLLNSHNQKKLTHRYVSQYSNLAKYIKEQAFFARAKFDLNWTVAEEEVQSERIDIHTQLQNIDFGNAEQMVENSDQFYTIQNDSEEQDSEHEIQVRSTSAEKQKTTPTSISLEDEKIELDSNGWSILPSTYLKITHPILPLNIPKRRKIVPYKHNMLKNDFIIDEKGGMKLVNKVMIAAQNNVIKFVMTTLRKNLFSGKGILNISLPVEIFRSDSNLQRLCEAMSLAPDLLEPLKSNKDPLARIKSVLTFAFTNSVLYFDIEKAFNPILGQTFQGVIDGCPVYAQQTSHHPPISSLYLVGRGYRVHASIESKMEVHINSGEGINQGYYHVKFDDGGHIMFETAPGEVSGLTFGDRKYNIKGSIHAVDPINNLVGFIFFEEQVGFFERKKWLMSDQMEGHISRVNSVYMEQLMNRGTDSVPIPSASKHIEQKLADISGRWTDELLIDGKSVYKIERDIAHDLVHYPYPLNSNSNYREDLLYRKRNDLARSQIEKERLEIFQRQDRKFRDKFSKTKH